LSISGPLDRIGSDYIDDSLHHALVAFGIARALNGVISVAQETEVAVEPAGVGVTFAPGQILDPINDLVERFSWVMLAASVSLGIQKLLLAMGAWPLYAWLTALIAAAVAFFLIKPDAPRAQNAKWLFKLVIVLLTLRFLVPVTAIAGQGIYSQFLQPQYEGATSRLEETTSRLRELERTQTPTPAQGGVWERAKRFYDDTAEQFDVDVRMAHYKAIAAETSRDAIDLIVVFIFHTVLMPLAFLFVAYVVVTRTVGVRP
jgi:hypothetical protein